MDTASVRWAVMAAGLLLAGCQQTPQGRSSFQWVETTPERVPQRQATFALSDSEQRVIEARALTVLATPEYPKGALLARTGRVVVPMRVVVGIEGLVTNVALRPGSFPALIPRFDEFFASIERAVRAWRFSPARILSSKAESDTSRGYTESRVVEMYFDIDFTFEPSVRSGSIRRL